MQTAHAGSSAETTALPYIRQWFNTGMWIRIRSDPLIFGLPDPDPVLFSPDPDPDPICNNGFIKLFSS